MDIEYQTYGVVLNQPRENEEVFFWKHPEKHISFRAVYDKQSKALLGINVFGIRMRHNICDAWINSKTTIDQVLVELKDANFDPEFFKPYEQEIIDFYNKENGTSIKPRKKSLLRIFG